MDKKPKLRMKSVKTRAQVLEEIFDGIIFYGWTDEKQEAIHNFLVALDPKVGEPMAPDAIIDELGDISNEFGEDCNGDWNGASERASAALGKLLKKVAIGYNLG